MKITVFGVVLLIFYTGCLNTQKNIQKRNEDQNEYKNLKDNYKIFSTQFGVKNNDTICDIAGGIGVSSSAIFEFLPSSTIFYEEDIRKGSCTKNAFKNIFKYFKSTANINNFRFVKGTKQSIPFESKSFNNVSLYISIHEFEYKEKMLNEVFRIMRDTGKLFLVETVYKDTIVKDKNCGFEYLAEKELYRLLDKANFKIIKDADSLVNFDVTSDKKNCFAKFLICSKRL